jgi:ribosome biogenesis GTPase
MRALSVEGAGDGVAQAFQDLEALARDCKYNNCTHAGEEGCALAAAMSDGRLAADRFSSWLRLRSEPRSVDQEAARRAVVDRKQRKAAKVADRRSARP